MSDSKFMDGLKVSQEDINTQAKKIIRGIDMSLQNKTYKNLKTRGTDLVLHIRENYYAKRKLVQAQFKTLGCNMKKAGSCWNCNYGVREHCIITPKQYVTEFIKALDKTDGDVLVLETLGSITDELEFSSEVLKQVLKIAIDSDKFPALIIETHISKIDEDLVKYISKINQGKKHVGFEVGIEDINPDNRKLINKLGVKNDKISEVYEMLEKYGITLGMNLIYGFPFMKEQERINALVNSVKTINQDYPNAEITLFLMSVKENTVMEYMQKQGLYEMPNPWGLVEATKEILDSNIDNTITYSWFGEKEDPYINETTAYSCPHCKELIIEFFRNMNGTLNPNNRNELMKDLMVKANQSECECYPKFKEQLDKNQDGKNPEIRYNEFMAKMALEEDIEK